MLGWELGNWTGGHTGLLLPLPGPLATAGAMTTKPGASSNGNVSCQTAGGQESEIKVWTGSCSPPKTCGGQSLLPLSSFWGHRGPQAVAVAPRLCPIYSWLLLCLHPSPSLYFCVQTSHWIKVHPSPCIT